MNNFLSRFAFTDHQILIAVPMFALSLEYFFNTQTSKLVLASSYGFFFTVLAKMYGNEIKC